MSWKRRTRSITWRKTMRSRGRVISARSHGQYESCQRCKFIPNMQQLGHYTHIYFELEQKGKWGLVIFCANVWKIYFFLWWELSVWSVFMMLWVYVSRCLSRLGFPLGFFFPLCFPHSCTRTSPVLRGSWCWRVDLWWHLGARGWGWAGLDWCCDIGCAGRVIGNTFPFFL